MSKPRQSAPEAIIPLAVYSEHQAARVLQVSRQKLLELLPELRLDDRTWRAFGYQILDALQLESPDNRFAQCCTAWNQSGSGGRARTGK